MKWNYRQVAVVAVGLILLFPVASYSQFGGVVYDPTNYANAVLRYKQLVLQLAQLRETYQQLVSQYQLAVEMAQHLKNMPSRYGATFSQWRTFAAKNDYGNTSAWTGAANGTGAQTVGPAYQQATIPLSLYNQADLQAINPADARNLTSAYASLELADGSNVSALTTVGNIRANAANIQQKILNLENDSLSPDAALNTQVEVLNKINASNVLTLRTLEDANNLRLAALEQQILQSKQQRDADVANLNFTLKLRQQSAQNLAPFTANLTQSLASYQLP